MKLANRFTRQVRRDSNQVPPPPVPGLLYEIRDEPATGSRVAGSQMPDSGSIPRAPGRTEDQLFQTSVQVLADWVVKERGSFTDAALERSALAVGYTSDEFAAAARVAEARATDRASQAPVKSAARRGVLAAYGVVWLLFATRYFGWPTIYGLGPFLQLILTIAMGIGLAISLLVIRRGRPDPDRQWRATALLLVVPVVLLVGVAGLCLPFTAVVS